MRRNKILSAIFSFFFMAGSMRRVERKIVHCVGYTLYCHYYYMLLPMFAHWIESY